MDSEFLSKREIISEREILSDRKCQELYSLIDSLIPEKKIKIGMNETMKAVHNGSALLVVLADDAEPKCLTDSICTLCEQQGIDYVYVPSKVAMGKACRLERSSIALCIYESINDSKNDSKAIITQILKIKHL